jgi:hypothetical protein
MHRHRAAVEAQLEQSAGTPIIETTLRGLSDRWDEIEQTGTDAKQIPAIARVMMRTAEQLTNTETDLISQLEAELRQH